MKTKIKEIIDEYWVLVAIGIGLMMIISVVPTLERDLWGYDSFYMHKVLFYFCFHCDYKGG